MKKFALILTAALTLSSSAAFAQNTPSKPTGSAAQAGTYSTSNGMAWGIGLGALVIVGLVVGLSAGAGAQSVPTYSH